MKSLFKAALTASLMLVSTAFVTSAQAGGSGLLPKWITGSANNVALYITNVTDSPVNVSVRLYDQNGAEVTSTSCFTPLDAFYAVPIGGVSQTLPANATGRINSSVSCPNTLYGYGVV